MMKEVLSSKEENIQAVLEECRKRNITVDDLLEVIGLAISNKPVVEETAKEENLEKRLSIMFKEIGIPAHIMGYQYLRYSIIYVAEEDPEAISMVTKVLYPTVAKKYGTTASRVERAIRHAIEVAWQRGNAEVFKKYFGYTIHQDKKNPTNSEFIATLVDYIKFN